MISIATSLLVPKITIITLLILISKVSPLQLSLSQATHLNRENILWDVSSRRALCYPTEEMMRLISGGMNNHEWGFTTAWNFSITMERIGEVFCHELGFTYMESIYPVRQNFTSNKIHWAASCLGYESQISHCQFEEFDDPSLQCEDFVGLRCNHCHSEVNLKENEVINITSPGYPKSYKDYALCNWSFTSEVCSSFVIKILYFSLPKENSQGHCTNGFLEVHGTTHAIEKSYCGSIKNKTFTVDCPNMNIRWFAGIFHPRPYERPGFSLQVRLLNKTTTKQKSNIIPIYKEKSMPPSAIVGLVIGVCAMMILLVAVVIIARYSWRKLEHRQSRRNIAAVLHRRGTARERDSLPTLPNAFIQATEEENRKISLTSAIYEDIERANHQASYLFLEEQKRRCTFSPVKDKESETKTASENDDFNFKIPTLTITSNDEFLTSCSDFTSSYEFSSFNDLKSQSEPSDMPSNLSFNIDQDSVFGNELNVDLLREEKGSRNITYTKKTSNNGPERRSSSLTPISNLLWSKRYKELMKTPLFGQSRFASEPNVYAQALPAKGKKCPRMNSGTFSTSHINEIGTS